MGYGHWTLTSLQNLSRVPLTNYIPLHYRVLHVVMSRPVYFSASHDIFFTICIYNVQYVCNYKDATIRLEESMDWCVRMVMGSVVVMMTV